MCVTFEDKKPMKGIIFCCEVRRDLFKAVTLNHNIKRILNNRYSILAAICIKGGRFSSMESEILEQYTNTCIFTHFVYILIEKEVLSRGDIFVMENC